MNPSELTAIVLAGDRNANDPLLKASAADCKALIEIDGEAMLQRVVSALHGSRCVDHVLISGPAREQLATHPSLQAEVDNGKIRWEEPQNSPSSSAYHAMQGLPPATPALITTADHPLLRADIVDYFLSAALQSGADVAVGLTRFASIKEAFPGARKTVMRFKDGGYCGCNLFAFMTPESRRVAEAWRRVEQQRKNPLRVISQLGWWSVVRYLTGRLSLETALEELSDRLNVRIQAVLMPFPEAAIDVDSIADQELVEGITGNDK